MKKKASAYYNWIIQKLAPSPPIQRKFPGPSFLGNIAVAKFADHQPLYRQSVIHARHGAYAVLITPLVEALHRNAATFPIHNNYLFQSLQSPCFFFGNR